MDKRVLILTTPFRPNIGGVETHLDDLIEVGINKGYGFTVLTYQPLITKATGKTIERSKGLLVFRIPWVRLNLFLLLESYPLLEFLYLFPPLFIAGLLYMLVRGSRITTIHSQGLVAGVIGFILSKLFDKHLIVSTHSIYHFPETGIYRSFVRLILLGCTKVLTLSKQSEQEIINLGIPATKVTTFTYWVDQKTFKVRKKSQARKRLSLPKDMFICLFVGRLVTVKGINELLKAIRITSNKKLLFLIAGDGPLASDVIQESKDNPKLIFKGKIDNKELADFYNAADVLVVPSIHEEGFGRVILEALSSGLPVIASNRGGIKEVLTPMVGVLIKVSSKNINNTLERLIENKRLLQQMQIDAQSYARIRFNKKNAQMILRYYAK